MEIRNNDTPIAVSDGGGEETRRVLSRVRSREDWPREQAAQALVKAGDPPLVRVCLLDTETTGLDPHRHEVIEICAASVLVNGEGRIVGLPSIGSGMQDPGKPLSPKISAITGLRDADLAGQGLDRKKLAAFIAHCDAVIAFNAGFDRPFVEAFAPDLPLMDWGCAMADVPWRELGFEPGPQNYLLMQTGKFNPDAHRARDDVLSLIELLDHTCKDGETVIAKVLKAIAAPAWRFEATLAPLRFKDHLKERGYRWRPDSNQGVWHKHVRDGEYADELAWYRAAMAKDPAIVPLPASERYRKDRDWEPAPPPAVNMRAGGVM
ncbi:MAG: 3'-5' exonuclease [Erythrobacter sp.]